MDDSLIYVKTNIGEEMVAERTRLVQRNLRMLLIMVDGNATVAELKRQMGDAAIVEGSLEELERLGLIESIEAREARSRRKQAASTSRFTLQNSEPAGQRPEERKEPGGKGGTLTGWQALEANSIAPDMAGLSGDTSSSRHPASGAEQAASTPRPGMIAALRGALVKGRARRQAAKEEKAFRLAYERATEADTIEPVKLKPIRRDRGRRRVIAWPLALLLLLAGSAFVLAMSAALFPYQRYVPQIERQLGAAFQDKVDIGAAHFSFLPYPNVTAENVTIGTQPYATFRAVRVLPDISWLYGDVRLLRGVEIDGLRLRGEGLAAAARWFAAGAASRGGVALRSARLQDVVVELGDTALNGLDGAAFFSPSGALLRVELQDDEESLRLEATPSQNGYRLAIVGAEWRSPFRPRFLFTYLDAQGEITPQGLALARIQARLYDGSIKGEATLKWADGITLAGDMDVKRMSSAKLFAALNPALSLDGDLSGKLKLHARAAGFHDLLDALRVDGDFLVSRGVINRFDLVDAVRGGNRGQSRGGATPFERMQGSLHFGSQACQVSNLRISSGLMHAAGGFSIGRDQALGGLIDVRLRGSASEFRTQVRVAGTLEDPLLYSLRGDSRGLASPAAALMKSSLRR